MVILGQILTYYTLKERQCSHKSSDIIGFMGAWILSEELAHTGMKILACQSDPWIVIFYQIICYIILYWGYIQFRMGFDTSSSGQSVFLCHEFGPPGCDLQLNALSVNHIQEDLTQVIKYWLTRRWGVNSFSLIQTTVRGNTSIHLTTLRNSHYVPVCIGGVICCMVRH